PGQRAGATPTVPAVRRPRKTVTIATAPAWSRRHPCATDFRRADSRRAPGGRGGGLTAMSVYKVIEIIGTSSQSWEDAALSAVKTARESLRDLRVARVIEQDVDLSEGDAVIYRTK